MPHLQPARQSPNLLYRAVVAIVGLAHTPVGFRVHHRLKSVLDARGRGGSNEITLLTSLLVVVLQVAVWADQALVEAESFENGGG